MTIDSPSRGSNEDTAFNRIESTNGDGIEMHGDAADFEGEGDDASTVGDDEIDSY